MHLIVFVDETDGMSFAGMRQSRDREVISHILRLSEGCRLWVSPYSAPLFPADRVTVHEEPQQKAEKGDYCVAEIRVLPECAKMLESVTLYCWNRKYPSTEKFPRQMLSSMRLDEVSEFPGYSHETITMERYLL